MFHLLLGLTALGASAAVVMAMIAIFSIPSGWDRWCRP